MDFGDEFLAFPELFPARRAGEPCGPGRVLLEFAGGPYCLTGLSARQESAVRRRFRGCAGGTAGGAAAEIRVFRAPASEFRAPGEGWREYRLDLSYGGHAVRVAGFHFMGLLERTPIAGALWTSLRGASFLETCDNFLRVVAAYRILAAGGVLIHSAALVRGGEALLFPGRSGAGKSTLCRLAFAAGFRVLSDELNVLAPGEGGLAVEQVPFTGDLDRAEVVPHSSRSYALRALCRLEKGSDDALEPLAPGRALGALLAAAPYVNRDPHRHDRLAGLLEDAVRRADAFTLSFRRTSRLAVLDPLVSAAAVDAA